MANDEHVALLKQGVTAWNAWREKNPSIPPDFNRADLTDVSLTGANLNVALLDEANLTGADLTGTDHRPASLRIPITSNTLRSPSGIGR